MSASRLVFVATPEDAPPYEAGTDVFVLDTAWTSGSENRPDLQSIRPSVSSVLERVDLSRMALERLDRWADAAAIADRMTVDGVSWWFRVRPFLADHLHERLLWAHVVAELLRSAPAADLVVPEAEPALVDVARSCALHGIEVTITTQVGEASADTQLAAQSAGPLGVVRGRWSGLRGRWQRRTSRRRAQEVESRLARLRAAEPTVLVVALPRIYQTLHASSGEHLVDPQLAPVIARIADRRLQPIVVGLQLDHRVDSDWAILRDDELLIPESLVRTRWAIQGDRRKESAGVVARLEGADSVPLEVEGVDLAPGLFQEVRRYGGSWLESQLRRTAIAERMIQDLRPAALFLNHEGIRTPWVAAARRLNVPTFAVQHGIIYAWHSVYSHPRVPGLLLPDKTFTYGPFERQVLLEHGGYRDDEVEVSGSPRLDVDLGTPVESPALARERTDVRRQLGVSPNDLMLVVSTAHTPLARRFHLAHMLDRLLGGPLVGVHIVFKQHPGETDEGPYRALIEGIARAGRYEPPRMTVVRGIDLYRLLRAADAHLGVMSTVLTDAVVAGTCNLISTAAASDDLLGYVAAGVARPVHDIAELRDALLNPQPLDRTSRRAFIEAHFQPGDASGRIADAIVKTVEQRRAV